MNRFERVAGAGVLALSTFVGGHSADAKVGPMRTAPICGDITGAKGSYINFPGIRADNVTVGAGDPEVILPDGKRYDLATGDPKHGNVFVLTAPNTRVQFDFGKVVNGKALPDADMNQCQPANPNNQTYTSTADTTSTLYVDKEFTDPQNCVNECNTVSFTVFGKDGILKQEAFANTNRPGYKNVNNISVIKVYGSDINK